MNQDTLILLSVLFLAFIAIPFVPHESFMVLDYAFIRVLLLGILLFSLRYGPLVGVATFMLIAALLLERNYRIMSFSKLLFRFKPRNLFTRGDVEDDAMGDAVYSEEIQYVDNEVPELGESEFAPKNYAGENDFEPLNLPENHKEIMESAPLGTAAGDVLPTLV